MAPRSPAHPRLYRPWRKEDYLRSLASLVLGLVLLAAAWLLRSSEALGLPAPVLLATPAAVILVLALRRFKRGRARSHGKAVEVTAVAGLRALLPSGWSQRNGLMTSRGDVDLWLATEARPFAVEIKSHSNVRIRYILFFFWPSLRHLDGRKFKHEAALDQAKDIAREIGAAPVLWFPASHREQHAIIRGTLVVLGGPMTLIKAVRRKGHKLPS